MFLHGFDNATIRWGDTIRNPKLKEGDELMKFDTVVGNPPFSTNGERLMTKKKIRPQTVSIQNQIVQQILEGVPPKSKGDWAFITHMIETTYEGTGKVGVVVPRGVLFRGQVRKIRKNH